MATYMTKQKKALVDILSNNPHEIFSVSQIISLLNSETISDSSVYRLLAQLHKMGMIKKTHKEGTREACYQYIKAKACENQIHLFCKTCEKSFHLNIQRANTLANDILKNENFLVDTGNTVIYGICKNCLDKRNIITI